MTLLIIPPRTVHLWLITLPDFISEEQWLLALLSPDETERAMRFRFALHRQRFIVTRSLLRKTLSLYTGIMPNKIVFTYGPQGKPYLQNNKSALQFNVSHSEDMAILAFTTQQEMGVDIEKMEPHFKEEVAKRFFSQQEYTALMALEENARIKGFYQIWSRKEAIIKTLGTGLLTSLSDFSVNLSESKEIISLIHLNHPYQYHVENCCVPEGYQAAFATVEGVERVIYNPSSLTG